MRFNLEGFVGGRGRDGWVRGGVRKGQGDGKGKGKAEWRRRLGGEGREVGSCRGEKVDATIEGNQYVRL